MKCRKCSCYTKVEGNVSKGTDYGICTYMDKQIEKNYMKHRNVEPMPNDINFGYYSDAYVELPGITIQINEPKIRIGCNVSGSFFCAHFCSV